MNKRGKIFCVATYLKTKSFKTVQAKFRRKFNFNNNPYQSQIYRRVHRFQASGSVDNHNKKVENPRSGRKLTDDVVRDVIGRSPKKFFRRRSQELGLSRASLQKILKKDLQLYPYRIQIILWEDEWRLNAGTEQAIGCFVSSISDPGRIFLIWKKSKPFSTRLDDKFYSAALPLVFMAEDKNCLFLILSKI